jgi:hypothetical protein
MTRRSPFAALALLTLLSGIPVAQAQATAPNAAAAARLAKLKAKQDAIIAAAKARAAATASPAVTTAPPPVVTKPPVVTAAPKATTTPPATSASVKPVASAPPATSASAAPAPALATHTDTAAIALDLDALKKTRPDRRHAAFLDLQARFGNLLSDPRATVELKQHAQRVAYLQRIRALGVKANDATFVKGVDAQITTEESRDANALNALRTSALPAPAAATATAVAVPVAAAAAGGGAK